MDVAAKTGTTNDSTDRWLCGFTPYYAAATWFGFDKQQEVKYKGSPSNPSGGIWSSVMKDIHKNLEGKKFIQPDGIIKANVCKKTGLVASEKCPETYSEVFTKGTVPTETCSGPISATICTETKLLANEYCPHKEEKYVFPRSPNEKNPVWQTSYSEGTLPTDTCTVHAKKEDKTKPVITLKGSETITITLGEKYMDPGATAKDEEDGDLTSKIVIDIS